MAGIINSIKDFIQEKGINKAALIRQIKEDNKENETAKKLTPQKFYQTLNGKRPLPTEEFILIIAQLKKNYPNISADTFINFENLI